MNFRRFAVISSVATLGLMPATAFAKVALELEQNVVDYVVTSAQGRGCKVLVHIENNQMSPVIYNGGLTLKWLTAKGEPITSYDRNFSAMIPAGDKINHELVFEELCSGKAQPRNGKLILKKPRISPYVASSGSDSSQGGAGSAQ